MTDQIEVFSRPSELDSPSDGCVAVVIDVLRATTTIIHALAAGAKEVIPLLDIEQARKLKAESSPETVVLGGERQGKRIGGFDLANSPEQYTPETVGGKTLVFTTTNGTVAMHAVQDAETLVLAAFVNAKAVVEKLKHRPRIRIVCAGTDGRETEEDLLLAGCLVHRLLQADPNRWSLNETAKRVQKIWEADFKEHVDRQRLVSLLRASRGGLNLVELGFDADIEAAARIDSLDVVPETKIRQTGRLTDDGFSVKFSFST